MACDVSSYDRDQLTPRMIARGLRAARTAPSAATRAVMDPYGPIRLEATPMTVWPHTAV